MMPSLSFTGGAGGAATNGDFAGKSASGNATLGGSGSGGSRGIVMNIGKNSGGGGLAAGSDNTLLYIGAGLAALVLVLLVKR